MTRFTFEATRPNGTPDPTPRRFVGMWRPPYETFHSDLLARQPWRVAYYETAVREAWLRGEGDRPLYAIEADE